MKRDMRRTTIELFENDPIAGVAVVVGFRKEEAQNDVFRNATQLPVQAM